MGWTCPARSAFRTAVARIRQIARDACLSWDMFEVNDQDLAQAAYEHGPVLPPAGGFLLFGDASRENKTNEAEAEQPERSRLVPEELPLELQGLPVFQVGDEHVVFVAHVLARVLECQCRANRHFGLFKDKKHNAFRRMVDTSNWRYDTHYANNYKQYRDRYSLLRVKDSRPPLRSRACSSGTAARWPSLCARRPTSASRAACRASARARASKQATREEGRGPGLLQASKNDEPLWL